MQTIFHHGKQHGFFRYVGNVILTKINTYHIGHHWLCEERHLVPWCKAPNWWCFKTHNYQLLMLKTLCVGSLHCLMGCAVEVVDLGERVYFRWRSGCRSRPHLKCGAGSSYQCTCWGMDHDPYEHSLLDGTINGMWLPTHNGEMVKFVMMTWGVGMVINGEGALRCFFSLFPKVLADIPIYSSSHYNLSHLYLYIIPIFVWCCPSPWVPLGIF